MYLHSIQTAKKYVTCTVLGQCKRNSFMYAYWKKNELMFCAEIWSSNVLEKELKYNILQELESILPYTCTCHYIFISINESRIMMKQHILRNEHCSTIILDEFICILSISTICSDRFSLVIRPKFWFKTVGNIPTAVLLFNFVLGFMGSNDFYHPLTWRDAPLRHSSTLPGSQFQ